MTPIPITDPDDPRVAEFRHLNDSAIRRQLEAPSSFHQGILVAEGWLAVERLLPSRHPVRAVLIDDARRDRVAELLGGRPSRANFPLYAAERAVLDAIVGFPMHRGIVAVAERGRPQLSSQVIGRARRMVVLEGVNDAENLGAICRNAVALGADALLVDPTSADPLSRRSIRVSTGHALALPHARLAWPEGLHQLTAAGVRVIALTPSPDAQPVDEVEIGPEERVALLFGAEGPGLSEDALRLASERVRIPMAGHVDSLNIAAASAIATHRLFG